MPLRSPVLRKLLLSALALIFATLGGLDFYLTRHTSGEHIAAVEHRLASEARILAGEISPAQPAALEDWARQAEARARARVTVIDAGGVVLADSQHDPGSMENHKDRPEVRTARQGQVGISIRHSGTLDRDLCYVAVPWDGMRGAVLRLAVPLKEVDAAIAAVRWRILVASLIAAAVALAMAYVFSRRFTARVRRLQEFAEHLLQARFTESLPADADDELGALAASLNHMAMRLRNFVETLSVESARQQAILSGMAEGVLAVDTELRVIFCNDAFARAVGARLPVPERLPILNLVRDPAFLDMLSRTLVTGQVLKQKLQIGGGRVFEALASPLGPAPRRGAIAILHDITELERLERVRTDFVANVSHELRTPLTAIRGYAETLLDGALEDAENNRKFLEIIRAHAIRLNNVASDLLVLSELESGQPQASPEPVSIREALEAALRTVESEARVREVALRSAKIEDVHVLGHKIRLEQAFVNLLDNAVKFNRPGGEVRVDAEQTSGGQAQITIADTGIGIPLEDQSRIFERFYRVDKARSRAAGGTGLGLSIVKHVVERMGGEVSVESELGQGSRFTVRLPAI